MPCCWRGATASPGAGPVHCRPCVCSKGRPTSELVTSGLALGSKHCWLYPNSLAYCTRGLSTGLLCAIHSVVLSCSTKYLVGCGFWWAPGLSKGSWAIKACMPDSTGHAPWVGLIALIKLAISGNCLWCLRTLRSWLACVWDKLLSLSCYI